MRKNNGFTLLEIMVVVAIMGIVAGVGLGFMGGGSSGAKKEVTHLISTIRFAYHDAANRHLPNRIVFDLNEQQYWVESGSDTVLLKQPGDEKEKKKKPKSKLKKSKDPEEAEAEEPVPEEPSFSALEDSLIRKTKLDKVLRIKDVFVANQEKALTEGQAYLYFFPNGQTENAVLHLADEEEKNVYSIIINPVTAHAKVVPEYVEYENITEEE